MAENTEENKLENISSNNSVEDVSQEENQELDDFDSLGLIPDENNSSQEEEIDELEVENNDSIKEDELSLEDELLVEDTQANQTTQEEKEENFSENSQSQILNEDLIDDTNVQKKESKLKFILIIIIGFLSLLFVTGSILYFIGFFDPEEIEEPLNNKKTLTEKKIEKEAKKYKFNLDDINTKRLNRKLTLLTKYEIIENDDKELLKSKEKSYQEKLKKEKNELESEKNSEIKHAKEEKEMFKIEKDKLIAKNKKLEDELAMANKKYEEETNSLKADAKEIIKRKNALLKKIEAGDKITPNDMKDSKEILPKKKEDLKDDDKKNTTKEVLTKDETLSKQSMKEKKDFKNETAILNTIKIAEEEFLHFIQVKTIKNVIYNSFIKKIENINSNIKLCRDETNKIEIFVGPFESDDIRTEIINKLQENIVNKLFTIDLTKDEYNKRCNY